MDTLHPGCVFLDVFKDHATWMGTDVSVPCYEYTDVCYTHKLIKLFKLMLATDHDVFYYVESDHAICDLPVIRKLATAYLSESLPLITTGIGASGWLFNRKWATAYVREAQACTKWCFCPDCIAATLPLPRATTRVVLTQHTIMGATGLTVKQGQHKMLPRCYQKRTESGLNRFDFFDHNRCHDADVSPCNNSRSFPLVF